MSSASSRRPALVYHYTSAAGFLGIIQSRSLWATDLRFLNDSAEFTFARDALLREVRRRAGRLRLPHVRQTVFRELDHLSQVTVPAHVVSFSARGNALSQWRAYGTRDGVAIGFHRSALESIENFTLRKCYYAHDGLSAASSGWHRLVDEIEQNIRWVSRLIQQEHRKSQSRQKRADAVASHAFMIPNTFVWAALQLKHSGFGEEEEWRLIDSHDRPEGASFRPGNFGVTPYVQAPLPDLWKKDFPLGIAEVVVGPSPNAQANAMAINDLLKVGLGSNAKIIDSGIPFRS